MSSLNNGQYGGPTSSTASPAAGVAVGGGAGGHWTDSLPRRDFYSNIAPTGSLPRRDKAGLGRPEPPRPPQNFNNGGLNTRRRDGSLNRENTSTFKDAFMAGNKGRKNLKKKKLRQKNIREIFFIPPLSISRNFCEKLPSFKWEYCISRVFIYFFTYSSR